MWDCGHVREPDYTKRKACASGQTILFGERNNRQSTTFPPGVGLKVGPGTGVNYLVLRIHYAKHEMFAKVGDTSGLTIGVEPASSGLVTKRAGLIALGPGGSIPPLSMETMDVACKIKEDIDIHPFFFRTHSHKYGRETTGWKIDGQSKEWQLIGRTFRGDASKFYDIHGLTLTKGDFLAARCVMNNTTPERVYIGATIKDEMCNLFLYYYVDGDTILKMDNCWTPGPPTYRWTTDRSLPSLPDRPR